MILIFFTFLCFTFLYSSQYWDDAISEKKPNQNYSVFAENVNVRQKPDMTSKVELILQPGDLVLVQNKEAAIIEINSTKEHWYKISYKGKSGYIWGGLLADAMLQIQDKTILVRNLGVKNSKMEIRLLEKGKTLSKITWDSGPAGSDKGYEIKIFKPISFKNPPLLLFAVGYFVYSEIEGGASHYQMITLNQDKTLKSQFSWNPASCDPPYCGDTTLLFPGESVSDDPKTKRKSYKAKENVIAALSHGYNIENNDEHDYFINEYLWNGRDFVLKEK